MTRRVVLVRCSFDIPVDFSDFPEDLIRFDIEENSCPGTHNVGRAVIEHIRRYTEGEKRDYCWACALSGKNIILDMDYKNETPREP